VKAICVIVVVTLALLGLTIAQAYVGGMTTVYLLVPWARLTVNGASVPGWVYRGIPRGGLRVTLDDPHHRQSYWFLDSTIGIPRYRLHACTTWTAPRLPMFTEGDYGFPCFEYGDNPPDRRLVVKPGFIEFSADDGRRVGVRW